MATEILKLVADIIRVELALKNDQVVIYNQKFEIPTDNRLYVSVGLASFKNFGSRNDHQNDPVTGVLRSVQSINRQETYSIVAYSRGPDARTRNWEIVAALKSDTAQRYQESFSFKLAELPASMVDTSEREGTAILNKYSLLVNALVVYQKTQSVPFFDQFPIPPVIVSNP